MVRQIFDTMQREINRAGRSVPPPRFLAGFDGGNIYRIYFCIKEKTSPQEGGAQRGRLDSLAEITNASPAGKFRRLRTKSEAVKDLNSESIDKFVQAILTNEFRVFEDYEQPAENNSPVSGDNKDDDGGDLAVFHASLAKLRNEAGWSD